MIRRYKIVEPSTTAKFIAAIAQAVATRQKFGVQARLIEDDLAARRMNGRHAPESFEFSLREIRYTDPRKSDHLVIEVVDSATHRTAFITVATLTFQVVN